MKENNNEISVPREDGAWSRAGETRLTDADVRAAVETLEGTVLAAKREPAERIWKRKAILEHGEVRYFD